MVASMASEAFDELAAAFARFDAAPITRKRLTTLYASDAARDSFEEAAQLPRRYDSDIGELRVMSAPGDKRHSEHPDEVDGAPSWYELGDRHSHLESRAGRPVKSDFTMARWRRLLEAFDWACAYCGSTDDVGQDHVTPISKGGEDLMHNILPACFECNDSKGHRRLPPWLESRGQKFMAEASRRIVAGLSRLERRREH